MTRETKHELLELLEALCEERLTDAQVARLEEIVLAHRSARRFYLDYLHLHGTLLWDAARADDTHAVPAAPPAGRSVPAMAPSDSASPLRRRRRWVGLACTACLLAVAGIAFWPGGNDSADPPTLTDNSGTNIAPQNVPDEPVPIERGPHYRPIELPRDLLPPTAPPAPVVASRPARRVEMPADLVAFLDEQLATTWQAAGVEPSPPAGEAEWLRRVYLDLAGRIPAPDQVRRFLEDERPDKRREVVDQLLASADFSRNFASVWTNLLVGRSDEMARPADRGALFAFLRRSFAENRPWSETVARIISAEGPIDGNSAGNFLVAHLNNQAVPATAITARIFLGTQVECMQCHHHPFNDWTQRDFWEFNAFFKQTAIVKNDRQVPALVSKPLGGPTMFETRRGLMQAAWPVFEGTQISDEPTVDRRGKLAELMAEGEKPQLAVALVNRVWAHLFGAGFTNPIDDMGPHNSPTHPLLLDRLSRAFVDSGYDIQQLVRWITRTRAYQLSSRLGEANRIDRPAIGESPLFSRVYPKRMTVEQAYDSLLVATRTDPPLEKLGRRNDWSMQFVETYSTDENNESIQFAGSIPAALALMNGAITETGLSAESGTRLHAIITGPGDQSAKLHRLAQATLGRRLSPEELAAFTQIIRRRLQAVPPASRPEAHVAAYQDVLWALLNSAEFVMVP